MMTHNESLTDRNLAEVLAFFHRANPFAERTWGWDSGRFVDWRWSGNAVRHTDNPEWFSDNCQIFRSGGEIRAVWMSENSHGDACAVTASEDAGAVAQVLSWLVAERQDKAAGLEFHLIDSALWLREVFIGAGWKETSFTGHEWEYDLSGRTRPEGLPEGFTVGSLADPKMPSRAAIAECIAAAFDSSHDIEGALLSLESSPMFRPELSLFVRSPEGRVAAYCRGTTHTESGVCGIDPVCTHPEYQRMGLGRIVVESCFAAQRELGGRISFIGSAPEPDPSTFLYRSLEPVHRHDYCSWTL